MSVKFLLLGGGVGGVWGGGGECRFYFYGREDFSEVSMCKVSRRCPAAILVISRDTCSDGIAKMFCACFMEYRTIIARHVVKWDSAQMCFGRVTKLYG